MILLRYITLIFFTLFYFLFYLASSATAEDDKTNDKVVESFLQLVTGYESERETAYNYLEQNWQNNFTPMILETVYLNRDIGTRVNLMQLLQSKTGQNLGFDLDSWYVWLWQQNWKPYPSYAEFKSRLYRLIDPIFGGYFSNDHTATIRLDEVRWGGVRQDGIPPLRSPVMIDASGATYLQDNDIVFGLEVNGDVRAYPKRILAWHEMFVDEVGGVPVAGVYCTLCGTMILYKTTVDGVNHELGTSGFLYRSNKLMYDKKTQSLWNTLMGSPVIGPLTGKGIQLDRLSVVTTTWGEWRRRHPNTQVLSLETGYTRDYGEGAAYREYFATDDLMFTVPELDARLLNKDEILGLIFQHAPEEPVAIASSYLQKNPLFMDEVAGLRFVVLTDTSGAHRVYEAKDIVFTEWDKDNTVIDSAGISWRLSENALRAEDGRLLYRQPSHNAFWFGWYSAYKHTRLVKE